jgi:hypothetical protein
MTPKPSKSLPASSEESPRPSATPREMRKVELILQSGFMNFASSLPVAVFGALLVASLPA